MNNDIRETPVFREVEDLCRTLRQPGTGQISDATDVHVSSNGAWAAFAGTIVDKLDGDPPTRICEVDLSSGDLRVLTFGPNIDRLPKYSPDGHKIAFLSDRHRAGDFQLFLLDRTSGAARSTPIVEGWVEYLQWSPDGKRILLGVAGHGADISGGQGAVTSKQTPEVSLDWMPTVDIGDEQFRWRSVWVYDVASNQVRKVSCTNINVWETAWCGDELLAAIVSGGPGEGLWYTARLALIELQTGKMRDLYTPKDQLGWPSASPSGKMLAVVEAICSDRWFVAGDLLLVETSSGNVQRVDTKGVDVTYTEWRSERTLLLAGHRGFETVVGLCHVGSGAFATVWCSDELTSGGRYVTVAGFNDIGGCVLVGEGFKQAPEIAVINNGDYRSVRSFSLDYADQVKAIEAVERVSWKMPDGLEVHGWLLLPKGSSPHPLVMNVHGGPVWHWRPMYLGRGGASVLMLVRRGYAVFLPNPRGSTGRGQEFARRVVGDMGGADARDLLSGLDHIVERGVADPKRLGVTGGSYGEFMTSWLVTQDPRFAAAVSRAPVTNQVSEHLVSNIPHFVSMFLADHYTNPTGKYFERSPIMHAHKAKTPTLNICGALDRCTPPAEAIQFHNALLENGIKSVLVTYPQEGHGIRKWPAAIDYTARTVSWFEEHMAARTSD